MQRFIGEPRQSAEFQIYLEANAFSKNSRVAEALRSQLTEACTYLAGAAPIFCAGGLSRAIRRMISASSTWFIGSRKRYPVVPSMIFSLAPAWTLAIVGNPQAMASKMGRPKASSRDGAT